MSEDSIVRIDKFLWAVRLFKTRNQASEACRGGKVVIENIPTKPSREVKPGDLINVRIGPLTRRIQVIGLIQNRISAKVVSDYILDITPKEELERFQMMRELNHERRAGGMGRPTKKDRRDISRIKNELD